MTGICECHPFGRQGKEVFMEPIRIKIPAPNEKQKLFLADRHRHVAYGGARGGGKSWAVRVKAVLLCLAWPGIRVLILRKTYRELLNNHIEPLLSMLPSGVVRYNKAEKVLRFVGGSSVWFGYCGCDGDLDQYQGAEYDVIFFDEATQFKEDWIRKINLAVRQPNGFPKRSYYTCNPGGVSHGYIKRLFIDRRFEEGEDPNNYTFIPALVTDNTVLMEQQPGYIKELQSLPPKLRKAWLEGCWDLFEGQFFEEFRDKPDHYDDRRHTHVIAPFPVPDSWKIYRSFDWGYNKPYSCGWWAVDHDGVAYRILELYGCTGNPNEGVRQTPEQVFSKIAEIEREHPYLAGKKITGIADPAIWASQTGKSIADMAAEQGVYFSPGDNKRIPGWLQVHYRLSFDENGYSRMYVFSTCKDFIRTMPLLRYDDHSPEDLDTEGEDHIADETRYFCMARPIKPSRTVRTASRTAAQQALNISSLQPRISHLKMEIMDS